MIAYLSENLWLVWALIALLGLILELSSGDFFIMCFAFGACAAAIASPLAGFYVQLLVFVAVTVVCLFQVRPFALRYLHNSKDTFVGSEDAIVGQTGRVCEAIPVKGFGRVTVGGNDWKAVAAGSESLTVGTLVRVVARESITVTVEKVEND